MATAPFGDLVYLYVGTADFERDLAYQPSRQALRGA
jgi:hypothetical protein